MRQEIVVCAAPRPRIANVLRCILLVVVGFGLICVSVRISDINASLGYRENKTMERAQKENEQPCSFSPRLDARK